MSEVKVAGYNGAGNLRAIVTFDQNALDVAVAAGADPADPAALFDWFARNVVMSSPEGATVDLSVYAVFGFYEGEDEL
jgi:hypothetical protein